MEMKDVCFTSVAFGQQYLDQQTRLKQTIIDIYPDANIHFFHGTLPPKSRSFFDSLYGFKPHAIESARQMGYTKVIFLDPAMLLCSDIDSLKNYGIVAVKDDNLLFDLISERYLIDQWLNRDKMKEDHWHLVGGSLYYFDFTKDFVRKIFSEWCDDEARGMFGSQTEQSTGQISGHRNDETCMAVRMYNNGVEPIDGATIRYCNQFRPMFIKRHFK